MIVNSLDLEYSKDENENMRLNTTMWRFAVHDRQVKAYSKGNSYEYLPIIAPEFQSIIANPKIEEIFLSLSNIDDYATKSQKLLEILKEKGLCQFKLLLDLKAKEEIKVDVVLSDFKVILASKTMFSLTSAIRHMKTIVDTVLPKIIFEKSVEVAPKQPSKAVIIATEQAQHALGKNSKLVVLAKLTNIVLLLPETVNRFF